MSLTAVSGAPHMEGHTGRRVAEGMAGSALVTAVGALGQSMFHRKREDKRERDAAQEGHRHERTEDLNYENSPR